MKISYGLAADSCMIGRKENNMNIKKHKIVVENGLGLRPSKKEIKLSELREQYRKDLKIVRYKLEYGKS